MHRANADVEVESVQSSLNTVHTAADSQDRPCIPVVCLVLLVAMLMMVGLDCCCDYFSHVCRGWSGHYGKRESLGSVPNAVSPASKAGPRMPMRGYAGAREGDGKGEARTLVDFSCGYRNLVRNGRPLRRWQACELRCDDL